MSSLRVPVVGRTWWAWPKHPDARRVPYWPLDAVLTNAHSHDAHIVGYSVPAVPHKLSANAPTVLPDGVPMVLLIVDIDTDDHAAPSRAWLAIERAKLERLLARHPGAYSYRTRGGYRVLYRLAEPIVLRSAEDAAQWSATYRAWVDYLREHAGIIGDPQCADWTRLYRLPNVVRDGRRQRPAVIGDANAIGLWDVRVSVPARPPRQTPPAPSDAPASDFYSALRALDQGAVLRAISGTPLVGGQRIELRDEGERSRIIIDGAATNGFIIRGRIIHRPTRTERPDGGPLAATWCRHYGHDDATIRRILVEHVPELRRFRRGGGQ